VQSLDGLDAFFLLRRIPFFLQLPAIKPSVSGVPFSSSFSPSSSPNSLPLPVFNFGFFEGKMLVSATEEEAVWTTDYDQFFFAVAVKKI
jgi:hypothetical protein